MYKKITFTQMIRDEFDTHKVLTPAELYRIVSDKLELNIPKRKLQHRIRSRLNDMIRKGTITRIAPATYTLMSNKEKMDMTL